MKRVGIVGSGGMGDWHAARWQNLPVDVAGYYDADPQRANALAQRYGGQVFASLDALLSNVDIVDVCTPPAEHAATVIAAAHAGRDIVCEKPVARHLADARAMIAACEQAEVRLFVAHVVRFFPEFARAKQVVDSGALGRLGVVRTIRGGAPPSRSSWFGDVVQSGGVILDLGIHDIDYVRWLCGDVTRVFARGLTFRNLAVDHALITLRFANGVIGHIESSWAYPAGNFRTMIELAGTEGIVVHDSDDTRALEVQFQPGANRTNLPHMLPVNDPWQLELEHFLTALEHNTPFLVTPNDALEALRISLAAIESLRTGKPVDLATFEEAS